IEQTPVTVTPTVSVTTPTVESTPVTVATTAPVTQPTVEQTPVTVTPTVAVTTPTVESTPVTVATTAPITQPTVEQTPVTVTPTVAVTTPTVEDTPSTTPKFTTEPVVIRDTQTVLDELGLEEEDVFAALMNEDDDDMFADTPIASLMAQDKTKENERSAVDSFGPQLKPTEEETIQQGEKIALASVVPTVEREAPRYSNSPSSKWVPEEVYSAKIIPGMKTYEEEMSTYSQDKSWLYEDTTSGLLSDDTEEAIAMEKAKEMLEQEEKENARLAQENWDKLISDDVNDPTNPLFTYLSKENLEEIQTVSIVDKIREQELLSPAEKLANEKKSGLLAKTNEILKKDSAAKKKPVIEPEEEKPEEKELIAQVSTVTEEKPVDNSEKTDSNIVESVEVKKSNVWPYVAGGAGLLGLFVIFLIVFWKRDDDDDDKKNSLEKQGVNV
ncbi:MAG: hypothetical protein J6S91_00930, partial [Treponema sp.]|nr:hypothetical protein [Treponema sp.]